MQSILKFFSTGYPYLASHSKFSRPALSQLIISFTAAIMLSLGSCTWCLPSLAAQLQPFDALNTKDIHPVNLPNGKLAMVAYMLTGSDVNENTWRTALRRMRAIGVQVVEIGQIQWADTEFKPGQYKWGYAEVVLRINKEENLGLQFVADIGMFINPGLNGVPKLPKHLQGKSFDDPQVIASLCNLYQSFFQLAGAESVKYLFQHFENAEISFKKRPSDRPRAQKLLRESFATAKRMRPDIKTGVCIESNGKPHYPAKMIEDWNLAIGTDIVPIISFGPAHFTPEGDASRTKAEFESVLQHAHGMPIALNECGHHSSSHAGSSDEKQAAFVRELFALLRNYHNKIEFATWYEYSDLSPIAAKMLGLYLAGISANPFVAGYFAANMGSCGLFTHDGKAKPAAKAWCEEAAQYYTARALAPTAHSSMPTEQAFAPTIRVSTQTARAFRPAMQAISPTTQAFIPTVQAPAITGYPVAPIARVPEVMPEAMPNKMLEYYRDDEGIFSLSYPRGWAVKSYPDAESLVVISNITPTSATEIKLARSPSSGMAAHQLAHVVESTFLSKLPYYRRLFQEPINFGQSKSLNGWHLVSTFQHESIPVRFHCLFFNWGNYEYRLTLTANGNFAIDTASNFFVALANSIDML